MKFVRKYLNIILISLFFVFSSCQANKTQTVIPTNVVDVSPGWDGNEQNSGLITYIENKGFLITENAANKYIFLTEKYGSFLAPPVKKGEGLQEEGQYFILTNQYMSTFVYLSQVHKNNTFLKHE